MKDMHAEIFRRQYAMSLIYFEMHPKIRLIDE